MAEGKEGEDGGDVDAAGLAGWAAGAEYGIAYERVGLVVGEGRIAFGGCEERC